MGEQFMEYDCYSDLVKLNRQFIFNLSLRELSEKTGIHFSTLNKFENNKLNLSFEQKRRINEFFKINENFYNEYGEIELLFNNLIKDICYDTVNYHFYENKLNQFSQINSSKYYSCYLVMKFVISYMEGNIDDDFIFLYNTLINNLIHKNSVYDIFYMYGALYNRKLNKYDLTKKFFNKVNTTNKNKYILALYYYYSGSFYYRIGQIPKSINSNYIALALFKEMENVKRSCYTLISLGNAYLFLGMEVVSINSYYEAISLIETNNIKRPIDLVKYNIGYAYIMLGQYDKALYILNEINTVQYMNQDYYFYLAWIYYKQGHHYKCKQYLNEVLKFKNNECSYKLAKILLADLNNNAHKRYRESLEKLYYNQKKQSNYTWLRFIAMELIEKYKEVKDYEKVSYWQDTLIIQNNF